MTISPASQPADPDRTTYSLSNIHGDIMATVDADGNIKGIYMTGPFGEVLDNTLDQTTPDNSTDGTTLNYVGKHMKVTESTLSIGAIQMGVRIYIPELGRFLQIDPVDGGTLNAYVYAMDPVNQFDLSGKSLLDFVVDVITSLVKKVTKSVAKKYPISKPSGIDALTHWVGGSGDPLTYRASDIQWQATTIPRECQAYGCGVADGVGISLKAVDPEGFLSVNRTEGIFTGEVIKSGGGYRIRGIIKPLTDRYDFVYDPDENIFLQSLDVTGIAIGWTFGHKDYDIRFVGTARIDQNL